MEKIEMTTPEPQKALPVLRDAIDRHQRLLTQSITRTQERIAQLAAQLQVHPDLLVAGEIPHAEEHDMDLLELEGEVAILRHLQEQQDAISQLTLCS